MGARFGIKVRDVHGMWDDGINEPFSFSQICGRAIFYTFWNNLLGLVQYGFSSWELFFAILSHYIKILPFRRIETQVKEYSKFDFNNLKN